MKIAAYCRVSTDKESQLDSLENQKVFFKSYAEREGFELFAIYADEGISGRQLKKRLQFLKMLEDAKKGFFELVVVKDASRFARNTVDFLNSVRFLKSIGVDVRFLSGNQTVLGNSEFILTVFGALAQEESSNLSKRVKFGKTISAQKGRVPNVIYGYDRIDRFTLSINPREAETVKTIFSLYLANGFGMRKIADILNGKSIPTKSGRLWNAKTVKRILANPLYSGELVNHRYEVTDFLSGYRRALPESEHFHHVRPSFAIISREDFLTANRIMNARHEDFCSRITRKSSKNLYSCLIKCTSCGRSFIARKYGNNKISWRCSGRDRHGCRNMLIIREDDLNNALKQHIFSRIGNVSDFKNELKSTYLNYFKNNCTADPISYVKSAESKRNRIKDMYENGFISFDEFKARITSLDESLKLQTSTQDGILKNSDAEIDKFLSLDISNSQMSELIERISASETGEVVINFRDPEEKQNGNTIELY
ncbi:MAG: recombinase family protein [Oscillospiraceae bacterium]|nr:recombinase family protein [Oscillospiraceae bacterium]